MANKDTSQKQKKTQGNSLLVGAKMVSRNFPLVESIFKKAAHRLLKQFDVLITDADIKVSCQEVKSEYCETHLEPFFKDPLMCATFLAEEWQGRGILVSDLVTLSKIVKLMLGSFTSPSPSEPSQGKSAKKEKAAGVEAEDKPMTSIENHLCQRVFMAFVSSLEESFSMVTSVHMNVERTNVQTKADFFLHPRPSLVGVFHISIGDYEALFHVVLPYTMLQTVRHLLSEDYLGDDMGQDLLWRSHLNDELRSTDLLLEAVLSEMYMPLNKVLKWQVGQTLLLEQTPDGSVDVKCSDRTLFTGLMGQKKGSMALSIDTIFLSNRNKKDDHNNDSNHENSDDNNNDD
ncbi:hypothetical protein EIL50_01130 [bacterium NHP-B]|nr:hypothetical protein EIL50_01130 [bacterium NHP-B]